MPAKLDLCQRADISMKSKISDDNNDDGLMTSSSSRQRRDVLSTIAATTGLITNANAVQAFGMFGSNGDGQADFRPAKRATAYFVDSTKPPTLVPYQKAREAALLKQIGSGFGTSKTPLISEELNLNNMANKGLKFGLGLLGIEDQDSKRKAGTSFVFLGVDMKDVEDASLAQNIMTDLIKPRRGMATALGLSFAPLSTQGAIDTYLKTQDKTSLIDAFVNAGVEKTIAQIQVDGPIEFARQNGIEVIAMLPEMNDLKIVREEGLQNLSPERRSTYVMDPEGFIALTQDPKFKLYTDKSMMKNYVSLDEKDSPANFFAEQILTDEAVASAAARWAILRPSSLVIVLDPIYNVRFFGGANGRVERVCKFLSPDTAVDEESITTILLNPSAEVSKNTIKHFIDQISFLFYIYFVENIIAEQIFEIGDRHIAYKYGLSGEIGRLYLVLNNA